VGNGGLSLYRVGQAATRNPLCHTRSVSQLGIRFVIRAVVPLHKIETTKLRIQELVRSLIIIERTRLIKSRNTLRWRKRSKFHLHLRNFLATWILQFVSCQVTHWIPQNNCPSLWAPLDLSISSRKKFKSPSIVLDCKRELQSNKYSIHFSRFIAEF